LNKLCGGTAALHPNLSLCFVLPKIDRPYYYLFILKINILCITNSNNNRFEMKERKGKKKTLTRQSAKRGPCSCNKQSRNAYHASLIGPLLRSSAVFALPAAATLSTSLLLALCLWILSATFSIFVCVCVCVFLCCFTVRPGDLHPFSFIWEARPV
jgi:hypothetical protein